MENCNQLTSSFLFSASFLYATSRNESPINCAEFECKNSSTFYLSGDAKLKSRMIQVTLRYSAYKKGRYFYSLVMHWTSLSSHCTMRTAKVVLLQRLEMFVFCFEFWYFGKKMNDFLNFFRLTLYKFEMQWSTSMNLGEKSGKFSKNNDSQLKKNNAKSFHL